MPEFDLRTYVSSEDPRIHVVELSGSLDMASIERLTHAFDELAKQSSPYAVVDLERVDFFSSPAVGALMGCRRRLIEVKGNMVLVGLNGPLREKLALMGANRIFRHYPDIKSVLGDFRWEYDNSPQRLSLQVPTNAGYVPSIRRLISGVVQQKGYSRKDAFRIETIIDELANNAIEHGDRSQSLFYIDFFLDREKVEVVVRNTNKDMDAATIEKVKEKFVNPVVDEESIRGRGLALVKMLSNEVKLQVDNDGTMVHVTKMREE